MARRDSYHNVVVEILEQNEWQITHDPYVISYGGKDVYADLGAG